jgi:hypothetical protein
MASKKAIEAGGAFIRIFADDSPLRRTLKSVAKRLQAFSAPFITAGKAIGGAMLAAGAGVVAATRSFANYADQIGDISQRTGLSTEAISELGYAAKLSGSSVEDLEKGFRTLQKGIGSGSANKALEKLGLDPKSLAAMAPDEQFMAVADAIGSIADPAQKTSMAMALFGKAGANLIPMISGGRKELEAMRAEARSLGVSMSGENVAAGAAFNDALDKLFMSMQGIANAIGKVVAPMLTWLADQVVILAGEFIAWMSDLAKFTGSWNTFTATLKVGWLGTTGAIMSGWDGVYASLVSVTNTLQTYLEGAFDAIGVSILNVWDNMLERLLGLTYTAMNQIAKPLSDVLKRAGLDQLAGTVQGLGIVAGVTGGRAADRQSQIQQRNQELEQRAAARQQMMGGVDTALAQENARRQAARDAEMAAAQTELIKSMEADQKAAEEAARQRAEEAKGRAVDVAQLQQGQQGAETAGTFAAAAIAGLGASNLQQDMLSALLRIGDNTDELIRLDEEGGVA